MTSRMSESQECAPLLGPSSKILAETTVYPLIHQIRRDIIEHIDTPLSFEQLLAPDTTYTVVRPLTEKYAAYTNHATVFCLLLNRVEFIRLANTSLSLSTLSTSRAALCELLAIRLFRAWSERTVELATVLLTPWDLYKGCGEDVRRKLEEEGEEEVQAVGNALEMAILSKSKRFIKSPSCQKVIEGVWSGRVVYQAASNSHAIIADNYKRKPISIYNPHLAPTLDHYRLKVPRIRAMLEYCNFLILFVLFVIALEVSERDRINLGEWGFIIYAAGFTLDKFAAMQEHGIKLYSANLWNGFDLAFVIIYLSYLSFRTYGLAFTYHEWSAVLGNDILAVGACLMFPRLAFVTLSDNLMILALRSMLVEFSLLMFIAVFCFLGFLYALYTLAEKAYAVSEISWWMLDIWFGLDASGFANSGEIHPLFGPILMVVYACLSNTLILTVLVAILSKTFADISQDAAAESMFRKAVSTIEGVKSDAVSSYQAPFNIIAVLLMFPMKFFLSPRWFHKVNVTLIRISAFPILLAISVYERQVFQRSSFWDGLSNKLENFIETLPRAFQHIPFVDGLVGTSSEIEQVFEIEDEVGGRQGWDDQSDDEGWEPSAVQRVPEGVPADASPSLDPHAVSSSPEALTPSSPDAQPPSSPPPSSNPPTGDPPTPARKVAFPSSTSFASSLEIPSPRKRRTSMDGMNRVAPSPLARLFITPGSSNVGNASGVGGGSQTRSPMSSSFSMGHFGRRAMSMSTTNQEPFGGHRRTASVTTTHQPHIPSPIPEGRTPSDWDKDEGGKKSQPSGISTSRKIGDASDVVEHREVVGGDKILGTGVLEDRVKDMEKKLETMTDMMEKMMGMVSRLGTSKSENNSEFALED
ncbi:hypothetical protein BDY24DRAFT_367278 [Mrakia frigida]|uniref:uncharacterized protein n=1 Tax=Mrakia frigida TaxID=29902 RepID=UPI003FCC005A